MHYRERQEANEQLRQSVSSQILSDPPAAYLAHTAHLTAALDTLLSKVQQQVDAAAAGSSRGTVNMRASMAGAGSTAKLSRGSSMTAKGARNGPEVSWVPGVLSKMKGLLLEADRWVKGSSLQS
jgi:hypothetical protein